MVENKLCKGCKWNHYPYCYGAEFSPNVYMNIENLKESFRCGQKDLDYIIRYYATEKTQEEIVQDKITELENRIKTLEEAKEAISNG